MSVLVSQHGFFQEKVSSCRTLRAVVSNLAALSCPFRRARRRSPRGSFGSTRSYVTPSLALPRPQLSLPLHSEKPRLMQHSCAFQINLGVLRHHSELVSTMGAGRAAEFRSPEVSGPDRRTPGNCLVVGVQASTSPQSFVCSCEILPPPSMHH